jgi:hypothetical protein
MRYERRGTRGDYITTKTKSERDKLGGRGDSKLTTQVSKLEILLIMLQHRRIFR